MSNLSRWQRSTIERFANIERLATELTAEVIRLRADNEKLIEAGTILVGGISGEKGFSTSKWEDRDEFLGFADVADPNPRKEAADG